MPVINVIEIMEYIFFHENNSTKLKKNKKYLWVCPNPNCYYWNYFENHDIKICSCKECGCYYKNNLSFEELINTFSEKYMNDHLWFETIDILNTKYALNDVQIDGQLQRSVGVDNFFEFETENVYRDLNGDILIMNKEIDDSVEAYKQHEKEVERLCLEEYERYKKYNNHSRAIKILKKRKIIENNIEEV